MTRFTAFTAALVLSAGAAFAQTTTQQAVLGETGDPVYSLGVQGTNGVIYKCKPEIETINGAQARSCIREDDGASLFASGDGLTAGGAVAAAAVVLLILADDSSSSTTTSTN